MIDQRPRVEFFGIGIDAVDQDEATAVIEDAITARRPLFVITPNVDFIMLGRTAPETGKVFRAADLSLCDSMPLVLAARALGTPLPERINGTNFFLHLCGEAARRGWGVFLMGGEEGVPEQTAEVLTRRFAGLRIVGCVSPRIDGEDQAVDGRLLARRIAESGADLLFVAFGTPKQERWIHDNFPYLGHLICMGVGASFDFVSGRKRRAPAWMQRWGLEWFHRLGTEPRRLWRRYLLRDLPFLGIVAREWLRRKLVGRGAERSDACGC